VTAPETLTPIIRLAARGDGVAEDGRFVAGAVPGDLVDAEGVLTPGPHRQAPACRHFGTCGGCQLQHVDDASFATYLTDRIVEALKAHDLSIPPIRTPHLSPPGSRRRASMIAERRGKQIILGYSEARSHTLVDLAECPVLHPDLFALLRPLRVLLTHLLRKKGRANIRLTLADQGVDLLITNVEADGLEAVEALADFAAKHQLARLSLDEGYGPTARYEPDPVTLTLGGLPVGLPEGAFLQATQDGEEMLVAGVREALSGCKTVTDLFAGLGTFALNLPGKVLAVEGARAPISALAMAANRAQRLVSTEHRDLYRRPLTVEELSKFDGVVIDPPRAGAREQSEALAASTVPRIAFVSCNPATFARDAKMLVDGGYRMEWIQPVGQFRWATHVELVASFVRGS
jgi:23S rRNA (uracil1939-C5)-methyltransferase